MTAPSPPPRGGAELRVSDERLPSLLRDARSECADLRAKLEAAEAERDRHASMIAYLVLQAQSWAAEAKCQRSTVHEAYRAVSGGAGEPGDWNGAQPVIKALEALRAALREMAEQRDGAWKAGRDAAADYVDAEGKPLARIATWLPATRRPDGTALPLAAISPRLEFGASRHLRRPPRRRSGPMPDITMCANETCRFAPQCYRSERSGTRPTEYRQSWSAFEPAPAGDDPETACGHYSPAREPRP